MTGASGGAYHRRVISHDLHALGFDAPILTLLSTLRLRLVPSVWKMSADLTCWPLILIRLELG